MWCINFSGAEVLFLVPRLRLGTFGLAALPQVPGGRNQGW